MNETVKCIMKSFVLLIVFLVLFQLLTVLFKPKWYSIWNATGTVDGFYQEKENSLDVIILGSSQVITAISPMQMYRDFGISAYNLGTEEQNLIASYYWLKEVMRYQSPKVVVLDQLFLFPYMEQKNNIGENGFHKAMDYMKMSPVKLDALIEISKLTSATSTVSNFILPITYYHNRWKELEENDFKYFFKNKKNFLKGFTIMDYAESYDFSGFYVTENGLKDDTVPLMEKYLVKIIDLCNKNGIALVLIKTPRGGGSWLADKYSKVKEIAVENNVPYLDFNEKKVFEAILFDPKQDYMDSSHVNTFGAQKISAYLGAFLEGNYQLPDRRDNVNYLQWDNDVIFYENRIEERA